MPRPRTVLTILAFRADGSETAASYEWDGEMQESTQLTSWMRGCGLMFWPQYAKKDEERKEG